MVSALPIDIQLRKLSDWLISRRICSKGWHDNIGQVREKIADALKDMPENEEIKRVLSWSSISYFSCKEILEVLKETEKDTKNMFGFYSSKRISDWQAVISLYERDNLYLAEGGQLLTQAVVYEVPSIKKQIGRLDKALSEADKRERDLLKKQTENQNAFTLECKNLGIPGDSPKTEIINLVAELPNLYKAWTEQLRHTQKCVESYKRVAEGHRPNVPCLPALTFLLERGNVTSYEYAHGEAPLTVEEPKLAAADDNEEAVSTDIDWGDDGVEENVELAPAEIDWGDLESTDITVDNSEINWGEEDITGGGIEITIEESGTGGGVATGDDALPILDNRRIRSAILDEIHELAAFCEMRAQELAKKSDFTLTSNDGYGAGDEEEGSDAWSSLAVTFNGLIQELTSGRLYHLHMVKTSSNYVNRMVSDLQLKTQMTGRINDQIAGLKKTREQASKEQAELEIQFKGVSGKTKWLQEQIEKDISKRYDGRQVNIIGGAQVFQTR